MQAGWSTGLCPWSEVAEAGDLSARIVHWGLWAVGPMGTVWEVEMMVTLVCVGERSGWMRPMMRSPVEPGE